MNGLNNIVVEDLTSTQRPARSHLSLKVRRKLGRLHKWRVDASRVSFSRDGPKAEGGFATVFQASLQSPDHHTVTAENDRDSGKQYIAVKRMKLMDINDRNRVLGLALREADLLASCRHPNIIKLTGFSEDIFNDVIWLVFPWADNGNLRDFVSSADWEVPERIWLINDIITGLDYLHGLQPPICHGDLKSVNILVNSNCRAIITDFGSARRIKSRAERPTGRGGAKTEAEAQLILDATVCEFTNTVTLTKSSFTLRWAAPEILNDEDKGIEADIWSFGWVCHEVMTGDIPFSNLKSNLAITLNIVKGNLPSPHDDDRMLLIRQLGSLMTSCWRVNPQDRPGAKECKRTLRYIPKCRPAESGSSGTSKSRADLLMELGDMQNDHCAYGRAAQLFQEALTLYTKTNQPLDRVVAMRRVADMHLMQEEFEKAILLYTDCIRLYDSDDVSQSQPSHRWVKCGKARALLGVATAHRVDKRISEAIGLYSTCVQTWEELGDISSKADALWGLAMAYKSQGKYQEAIDLCAQCKQVGEETGNKRRVAEAMWGLADIYRRRGENLKASQMYLDVIKICDEVGHMTRKIDSLRGLADIHWTQGEYDLANSIYCQCAQISDRKSYQIRRTLHPPGVQDVLV